MIPLTPPLHKSKLRIGDLTNAGDPTSTKTTTHGSSPVPPPPFSNPKMEGKNIRKTPLVIVDNGSNNNGNKNNKQTNRIPRSPNSWFVPVRYSEDRYVGSPPISPYHHHQQQHPRSSYSPATSLTSWTTTSTDTFDTTDFPMSPSSPSSTVFHYYYPHSPAGASYSSSSNNNNSTVSRYGGGGGGGGGSRTSTPTNYNKSPGYGSYSPLKSPKKKRNSLSSISGNSSCDDTNRKQRIKTELCIHYQKGNPCPFGVNCTYAHGEEELQKTRLMDLQRAGLIDNAETYRTKPCWTWVATGSCPFGKRCAGIHDPRLTGSTSSWLPHTETQGNSISTDINVDGLHQKRLQAILSGNPFGDQFSLELDDWADLYKLVCNTNTTKRRRNSLSEIHKLSIALQMRGNAGWMYKYRPQHFIGKTLCMILSQKAFRLEKGGKAVEIPFSHYKQSNSTHVLVRELAFGPDSDPSVRGVALFFNISDSEVVECTPQQAKKFRWKKNPAQESNGGHKNAAFDNRESFAMIRPHDRDAFELATDILKHRLETVQAERITVLNERFEVIKTLQKKKEILRETFMAHKRSWINWCWPITAGRQTIDDDTRVPQVDVEYAPIFDSDAMADQQRSTEQGETVEPIKGSAIRPIWESFVNQDASIFTNSSSCQPEHTTSNCDSKMGPSSNRARLPILVRLGRGQPICLDRSLPHIRSSSTSSKAEPMELQSERCWRALLLNDDCQPLEGNEWSIVQEHFQNSRSKKVLKIIQN